MKIKSKLPNVGTTIFTVMSTLANEHNAINLSQGFPNFECSKKLQNLVTKYISEGKNQYAPMGGLPILREKIAQKIAKTYGTSVDPNSEITITLGATEALYSAISAFIHTGDEVILIEPAYDSYRPSIEVNGGIPIAYELSAPDFKIDWQEFKKLITPKTKMIIINTPQNPIGKTFKKSDLEALETITNGTDILILSDEVYEHLTFDGLEHESVLKYPNLRKKSLATYSFGKTFHVTGWRVGYIVAPPELTKEFRKVHQFNTFSIHTPTQHAIAEFLDFDEEYLNLPQFFQKKRDFFLNAMRGSRLQPITCEGTYFQLFDYSKISAEPDTEFAKRMTTEFGVAAIPTSVFNSSGKDEKIIRLCFAKTEKMLEEAGKLLQKI